MIDDIFDKLLFWIIEKKHFYYGEFLHTKGRTKITCWKIYNLCVDSIEKAKDLYTENKRTDALILLIKTYEKAEKYAENLNF